MVELDPSKYIVTKDVPILDEGEITYPVDGGGTETEIMDPPKLRIYRDNMNRRAENSGDLAVGCVGHVKHTNGVDEESQAKVCSLWHDWKVQKRNSDGKWILTATEYLRPEYSHIPKEYPRRSPDVWLGRKEIGPIAYLGATEPHRDLGLHPLSLSRQGETVLQVPYQMADEKAKEGSKGDAKLEDCLNQLIGLVTQLTAKVDALAAGGPAAPAQEPEMSPEEAEAELQKLLGGEQEAPGKEPEPKEKEKPAQMARTDETVIDPEKVELKKKLDEVVVQLARQEVTASVNKLVSDGYCIEDVEGHINDLLALPADMRKVSLARIEKNYRKAPGAKPIDALKDAVDGTPEAVDNQKVISLARDEKLSYDAAFQKLYNRKPGAK